MALTQLHPGAVAGRRYGSFAGKPDALSKTHPVDTITGLHAGAVTGRRYGDFSGKGQVRGPVTQLHPGAMAGARYGSFAKTAVVPSPSRGGGSAGGSPNRTARRLEPWLVMPESIPSAEAFGQAKLRVRIEVDDGESVAACGVPRLTIHVSMGGVRTGEACGVGAVKVQVECGELVEA